ncbi:MAG: hypothetical protein AAGC68_11085, partial [Verrucomicrobiota bacterium]
MNRPLTLSFVLLALVFPGYLFAAEVIEIGASNHEELPGGKEADGIVGDFVLRNDLIEAVISGNLPLRRPNMSAFYGDGNHTPGCLYDLTLRDAENDQITIFTPCAQRGAVSYVRKIDERDLPTGLQAGVETVITPAQGGGIGRVHRYFIRDGMQGVLIVSTFVNKTGEEEEVSLADGWTQMRNKGSVKGIQWADAIDPAHKCGYAYAWVIRAGAEYPKSNKVKLAPEQTLTVARFLSVGTSPAEAVGLVTAFRDAPAPEKRPEKFGSVRIALKDDEGNAVNTGRVGVTLADAKTVYAYPDENGEMKFHWPVGDHALSIEDIGRETIDRTITVSADKTESLDITMSKLSRVVFAITAEDGSDLPCKVQFHPRKGTAKVDLGPTDRAHGCVDQWHSETGSFAVALPVGDYRIVVTRGPEFDALTQDIELPPGGEVMVKGQLLRSINSAGWVSTDFHNHSTPSGDNTCGVDDRLINLAAEQIEFAPTTEHNRLYDWEPHIE